MSLTFDTLREANILRLPLFKNRKGQIAHPAPYGDGSNWTPAQWLQAAVGELGEYANVRKKYERGDLNTDEFLTMAANEVADVIVYLDILCYRLGIDLGQAVLAKWNAVSKRMGVKLYIVANLVKQGNEPGKP